ncbi:MAG TPA: OmpA family protein [Bacteroidales bacterium]|nr:OmpA family protein [Bacteroidales bacterium]
MKNSVIITVLIIAFTFLSQPVSGQIKINLKKKINQEANKRANKKANEAVNAGFNKMEEDIEGALKKDADTKSADEGAPKADTKKASGNNQSGDIPGNQDAALSLSWNKYDFVPGDKVIFEDNLIGEENGEFPSRWDLRQGNVEIAQLGGENVIMFRAGSPGIVPYLKNPEKDYLPEIFTIEFDLYCGSGTFQVHLYDRKNQKSDSPTGYTSFKISQDEMGWANNFSKIPDKTLPERRWVHIAIAYTNGKLKGYIDETRLVNIPRMDFDPKGITLYTYIFGTLNEGHYYVKNLRIAEGGVKYYDRFLQDGKIVSNGIRFDVGKASLRPESMGVLNEIFKLLDEHPDVSVSVEGHTDSDGDFDLNQNLSQDRAKTVMSQLVSMGIDAGRITSKGFGESKPVGTNDTPEGKASNRRVEFVKNN